MRLSKTSALAALAVAFLHRQPDSTPVQARQVGEHLGIPTDSALKILQALARTNVIASRLGRGGGYTLHRDARQITLLEIVEAIDGPIVGQVPITGGKHLGAPTEMLRSICDQAATRLRDELARLSIADLASRRTPRGRDSHQRSTVDEDDDDATAASTPRALRLRPLPAAG